MPPAPSPDPEPDAPEPAGSVPAGPGRWERRRPGARVVR